MVHKQFDTFPILSLNDDCLYAIFERLDWMDLLSLFETCTRFQPLAASTFRRKFKSIIIAGGHPFWENRTIALKRFYDLFTLFGRYIQRLEFNFKYSNFEEQDEAFEMLLRECSTLKSLSLKGVTLSRNSPLFNNNYENTLFFENLEELTLNRCRCDNNIITFFENCTQLRKLNIEMCELSPWFLAQSFPQLESMTMIDNFDLYGTPLMVFFISNPQLIDLKIVRNSCIVGRIFEDIADHLPMLERLYVELEYFKYTSESIMHLLRLEHLNELQINCGNLSIHRFLDVRARQNKIKVLKITNDVEPTVVFHEKLIKR